MPYYMSVGRAWPASQAPRCKYCDSIATLEAPDLETLLCGDSRCHAAYLEDEGEIIEYFEDDAPWRKCNACGENWVDVDGTIRDCGVCRSEDTREIGEAEVEVA
jgi:hypothetical protein